MVWLSARDIDLLPHGPKVVRPRVLNIEDIAKEIVTLLEPLGVIDRAVDNQSAVAHILHACNDGPVLFVFDNFETIQQPLDVYNWIDQNVRSPNKVLITTRHSDFKGDFEVEVDNMTESQSNALVDTTASAIGMRNYVTADFRRAVYRESEGHPYVIKVLVGEAAGADGFRGVDRIVATRDDMLDALFERTYLRLSPAARRVFLTLGNWRSLVPRVALEAALLRPSVEDRVDVSSAIEELKRVSFVDMYQSPADHSIFLGVPLAACEFSKKKMVTAYNRNEIEEDTRFLRRFGAMQPGDLKHGLGPRVRRFFSAVSDELSKRPDRLAGEYPTLELIARHHPPAWLLLAELIEQVGSDTTGERTLEVLNRYLETSPSVEAQHSTLEMIAHVYRRRKDWLGYLNAVVLVSELPDADIVTVSGAANTFNSVWATTENMDPAHKREFVRRLIAVMAPRIVQGDATDCSRLAWLYLQDGNERRALEIVQAGLRLEPENEFCLNLLRKLNHRGAPVVRA